MEGTHLHAPHVIPNISIIGDLDQISSDGSSWYYSYNGPDTVVEYGGDWYRRFGSYATMWEAVLAFACFWYYREHKTLPLGVAADILSRSIPANKTGAARQNLEPQRPSTLPTATS